MFAQKAAVTHSITSHAIYEAKQLTIASSADIYKTNFTFQNVFSCVFLHLWRRWGGQTVAFIEKKKNCLPCTKQTVNLLSGPPQRHRRNYSITTYLHVK